ncbi:sulfurtransferase [Oleiphilus sp. HI0009]|nr:sulfurtransferase [Oleiphilus sp. HI0009]
MDRLFEFIGNHWELVSIFFGLLFALWWTEKAKAGQSLSPLAVTQLLIKDEAVIVDVRDKKDFNEGRITGSIHVPFTSFKDRTSELETYKDKQIIIADKMGQHSGAAGKLLRAAGFENVARLQGGIAEWKASNMPLVKK